MRVAVMQPTYLPWMGYFNLMKNVDRFVYLDDVIFDSRSWQQRNQIILGDKLLWLTVPVYTKGRSSQLINEVRINNETNWQRKHEKSLQSSFARAPYREILAPALTQVFSKTESLLADLNISFITLIASLLEINTPTICSSQLGCLGTKSARLFEICNRLGATSYISPAGSFDYVKSEGIFAKQALPVIFQNFNVPPYRAASPLLQGKNPSIIDALAWIGPEATRALIDQPIT